MHKIKLWLKGIVCFSKNNNLCVLKQFRFRKKCVFCWNLCFSETKYTQPPKIEFIFLVFCPIPGTAAQVRVRKLFQYTRDRRNRWLTSAELRCPSDSVAQSSGSVIQSEIDSVAQPEWLSGPARVTEYLSLSDSVPQVEWLNSPADSLYERVCMKMRSILQKAFKAILLW